MKKYLKQLRTNLILRSMGGYLKDDSFFDEWDQNRIEFQGSNYEFHNVAVEIADFGYYDRACQLLDSGIAQYPNDTDLLADYLEFGIKCNKVDVCNNYFTKLDEIDDKKNTWRSFNYLINFLIYNINIASDNTEINALKNQSLTLIERFKKCLPRDELAYLSEFKLYEATFEKDLGLEKLEKFLNSENRIAKVAPRCHLRFIDEMLEMGEYEKVVLYASDGAAEAAQEQESVDTGYFFYALALSKDALWLKSDASTINDDTDEARLILKYYQTAYDTLDDNKQSYFKVIAKRYKIISNISGLDMKLNEWRNDSFSS